MPARILAVLCVSMALSGAGAQTTPAAVPPGAPPAKPAAPETPPDQKAYNEANRIADPEKKIAALEKIIADFPGRYATIARGQILRTLIQKMPDRTDRIRKVAKAVYEESVRWDKSASKDKTSASTSNRGSTATQLASQLVEANLLLKDARRYARTGVESLRENVWMAEEREAYARRKQKIPTPEALAKWFAEIRAERIGTLGRVELKLGHTAAARKLLEESYAAVRDDANVGAALAELVAQSGDDAKALDYLIPVRLSGHAPPAANQAFEALYKKGHGGSLDGVERMLDAEYGKRFANPIHVTAYTPTEKRGDRVVLAEVFTGAGCGPCVGADVAFDAAMERYARRDLAVVMYHVHVPRPDPMTIAGTTARYRMTGVPTFYIDGKQTIGGGSRDMAPGVFEGFQKDLEADLEKAAEAQIKIDARLDGGSVRVSAAVDGIQSESKDLKVQILLLEKEIRYTGENGIRFHPMVVRAFGGEKGDGYALDANGKGTFEAAFDLDATAKEIRKQLDEYEAKGHRGEPFQFRAKIDRIDPADLAVVVFVQDDKTRHVLQAGYVDLGTPASPRPVTEAGGRLPR